MQNDQGCKTLKKSHLILGIGELLWDVLPQGSFLGGAPANFAVMAGRLGDHAAILSRIGRDDLGRRAVAQLEPMPADASFLQVDHGHETGRVTVALENGQPQYTIHYPAAWDFLEPTEEWARLAERADAVCFGSLAQRSPESRATIQRLVAKTPAQCIRVFDVNLRSPYYTSEVIQESLGLATVVKMNDDEAPRVLKLAGILSNGRFDSGGLGSKKLRQAADWLLEEITSLEMVAITRGSQGSLLVTRDEWHEHPGRPVDVVDTIGAGDAFTAAIVHYLLRGADLARLNEAGNRWGSWMASQHGAMPEFPEAVRAEIAAEIEG